MAPENGKPNMRCHSMEMLSLEPPMAPMASRLISLFLFDHFQTNYKCEVSDFCL